MGNGSNPLDMQSLLQPILSNFQTGLEWLIPAVLVIGGAIFGVRKGYAILKGFAGK